MNPPHRIIARSRPLEQVQSSSTFVTFGRLLGKAYPEQTLRPRVVVVLVELLHQVRVLRVFLRVLLKHKKIIVVKPFLKLSSKSSEKILIRSVSYGGSIVFETTKV